MRVIPPSFNVVAHGSQTGVDVLKEQLRLLAEDRKATSPMAIHLRQVLFFSYAIS
jgi:hypothetical protein